MQWGSWSSAERMLHLACPSLLFHSAIQCKLDCQQCEAPGVLHIHYSGCAQPITSFLMEATQPAAAAWNSFILAFNLWLTLSSAKQPHHILHLHAMCSYWNYTTRYPCTPVSVFHPEWRGTHQPCTEQLHWEVLKVGSSLEVPRKTWKKGLHSTYGKWSLRCVCWETGLHWPTYR